MNLYHIKQLTLTLKPVNLPTLSRQARYQIDIDYTVNSGDMKNTTVYLPIKEATYLWAWYGGIVCHPRTNAVHLGLSKSSKLACLLLQRTDIDFTTSYQAYQFFKQNFDSPKIRLLLGNDADEIAVKLEKNEDYHVIGGYLGGESESKDKARFRTELAKQINLTELVQVLIPQQCKNKRNIRLLNRFWQPLDCLSVKLSKEES